MRGGFLASRGHTCTPGLRSGRAGAPPAERAHEGRSRAEGPLLLRPLSAGASKETWLRFVDGRPVSDITTRFLRWSCQRLEAGDKKALLLIWDNASWHKSRRVRGWIDAHNRRVKASGHGVRIVACFLPTKSPWLNAIEPKWIHSKRKVTEPERLLGAYELAERVCGVFDCTHEEHLSIAQEVA